MECDKILGGLRSSAAAATALSHATAKTLEIANEMSKQPEEQQKKGRKNFAILTSIIVAAITTTVVLIDRSKAKRHKMEKMAEAESEILKAMEESRIKHKYNSPQPTDNIPEGNPTDPESDPSTITWYEYYQQRFPFEFKNLPPIISDFMEGCPKGFEEAMLSQLTTTLGATCFSRVQAKYMDDNFQRPALQTIIEGESGSGKDKFRNVNDALLRRRMKLDDESMQHYDDCKPILQTMGISVSKSRFLDILANNRSVHCIAFEPEIKTVTETMKYSGSIDDTLFRNAYDIAKSQRMNKDNTAPQGRFDTCFNFVFTGTPGDIDKFINKGIGVEGGNASRICWCVIPPAGDEPLLLRLPNQDRLDKIHDTMDSFIEKYCFTVTEFGHMPVPFHTIDLSYVNEALTSWLKDQLHRSKIEENKERNIARWRVAKTAFRIAMVFHMLWGCPTSSEKKRHIIELTVYLANYFMERYLHKFGHIQNQHHTSYMDSESVSVNEGIRTSNEPQVKDLYNGRTREEVWNEERESGISATEIAKKYNVSRDAVNSAVRRYRINKGLPLLSEVA